MPTQSVLVCSRFSTSADGVTSCDGQTWSETYVVTPEQQAQIELLSTGGFDPAVFTQFFFGTLMLFIAGIACGLIISQVRKLRRGV